MIRTASGLVLLLSSMTLAAQNAGTSELNSTTSHVHSVAGCPVDMHASQRLWDRTIRVREGESELLPQPFGQRISLNVKDSRPARIVGATVRIQGLNGKNRALPTPAETTQLWNAIKTLRVKFVEEGDATVSADIWIGGFTSVGSVQLLNVSYADGSVWTISGSSVCRVQPDPVMLITER